MPLIAFAGAFALNLILIPVIRNLGIRYGKVSAPRNDRWHKASTPTLGGIGIFISFFAGLAIFSGVNGENFIVLNVQNTSQIYALLGGALTIFLLGVLDDFKDISPPAKLVGQILAAAIVIASGYTTDFFTPRVQNEIFAQGLNVLFTFIWIVGISNAINLLDNMDGLAGGISLIVALLLSILFWRGGSLSLLVISLALSGAVLGFLIYNFPPAKIFMGDSGSLFLGFTLAVLAIARQPQASNVFAVLGVPTLLLLLPILDTVFVAITRMLRGDSPIRGGSDHTSHRLIAFGLSERQAVFTLYTVALIAGILAVSIESVGYWLSLVFVPILVIAMTIITAYLSGIKVISRDAGRPAEDRLLPRILRVLTYERRFFEFVLDILIAAISLYIAILIKEDFNLDSLNLIAFFQFLPVAIVVTMVSFVLFSVYQSVWKYVSLGDVIRYSGAVLLSAVALQIASVLIFPEIGLTPVVFLLFGVFLFVGLIASRFSFRILDLASFQLRYRTSISSEDNHDKDKTDLTHYPERVVLIGSGQGGDIALRYLRMTPDLGYLPVGFIDDASLVGRKIFGIEVLGTIDQLVGIVERYHIDGLLFTEPKLMDEINGDLLRACREKGCWTRVMKLSLDTIE